MPRPFVVLVLARCVNRLGAFSMAFLGVHLTTDLGASLAVVGAVLAVFGLATIPSRLLGGHLAGRVGAVPTIVLGLVGCAVAQLVIAVAASVPVALAGAVLLGLAFEVVEPPSQALVADLVDADDLPSAYALLWSALAVAGVAAGLMAALVARAGLPWLFVVDAATCLLCAGVVGIALRPQHAVDEARTAPGRARAAARPLVEAARDLRLLRHTAVATAYAMATMDVVFALPLTVERRGLGASITGVLLAVEAAAAVAATPLVRRVRRRLGTDAAALRLGLGVVTVGLAAAAVPGSVALLGVALAVVAVGSTLTLGPLQATAAVLAPPHARAAYLAVFGLSWGAATTLAPLVVSALLPWGTPGPWAAAAALTGALAVTRLATLREPAEGSASASASASALRRVEVGADQD